MDPIIISPKDLAPAPMVWLDKPSLHWLSNLAKDTIATTRQPLNEIDSDAPTFTLAIERVEHILICLITLLKGTASLFHPGTDVLHNAADVLQLDLWDQLETLRTNFGLGTPESFAIAARNNGRFMERLEEIEKIVEMVKCKKPSTEEARSTTANATGDCLGSVSTADGSKSASTEDESSEDAILIPVKKFDPSKLMQEPFVQDQSQRSLDPALVRQKEVLDTEDHVVEKEHLPVVVDGPRETPQDVLLPKHTKDFLGQDRYIECFLMGILACIVGVVIIQDIAITKGLI